MSDEWHFTRDGNPRGPVKWDQLRKLAIAGQLSGDDMIWTEGMDTWLAASNMPELTEPIAAPQITVEARGSLRNRPRVTKSDAAPAPREKLNGMDVILIFLFPPGGCVIGLITALLGKQKGWRVFGFSLLVIVVQIVGTYLLLSLQQRR